METHSFLVLLALVYPSLACFSGRGTMLRSGQLSCREKDLIVDLHNRYRQEVALGRIPGQPPATNMLQMYWDEDLANQAQRWADYCTFQHSSSSLRTNTRFLSGENLSVTWKYFGPDERSDAPDFAGQILSWFKEVWRYRGGFSHETGHYTQLVWGDSYLVGCGYTYYYEDNKYNKLYVCHYGPAGNIRGHAPYNAGNPGCTLAGTSSSREYPGLCGVFGTRSSTCSYG